MSNPVRVGILGVGEIAEAVVDGLMSGPAAKRPHIVLSPRSRERSARLAVRYEDVVVAISNQEVLDTCDVVLLSVLPGQLAGLCAELTFDRRHVVVGLAAGWSPSSLVPMVAPAEQVCQLIPLPMIRLRTGPIVLQPDLPAVRQLLDDCGSVVVPADESDVMALSCASATMSTFFALQNTIIDWIGDKGLDGAVAAAYVRELFVGLSIEALAAPGDGGQAFVLAHETPGGLNEHIRVQLTNAGAFDTLVEQLDVLYDERQAD